MIDDSALEKASGGAACGNKHFSGLVTWQNCVIGQTYYVVDCDYYFLGKLAAITPALSGNPNERTLEFRTVESGFCFRYNSILIDIYTTMTEE